MKRQRPQWQTMCAMLTLLILGILTGNTLGEVFGDDNQGDELEGELARGVTVPPVLQPIRPPNEDNVTSVPIPEPTIAPSDDPDCPTSGLGEGGCAPVALPGEGTFGPSVAPFDFETPGPFVIQTPEPSFPPVDPRPPITAPVQPPFEEPTDAPPVEEPTDDPPVEEPTDAPPVEEPTDAPPVEEPTEPPPPPPVEQTPQPVEPQTPQPVDSIQTPQPVEPPVVAPVVTPSPVESPMTEAPIGTPSPRPETAAPVTRPTQSQPTQLSIPPTSSIEEIPITPFMMTLGFDEQQTGTAEDLQILTSEMERIVSGYLFDALNEANLAGSGVTLESVDLTVTPNLRRRRRAFGVDNVFLRRRRLQQETVDFTVSGNAIYSVVEGANVNTQELTQSTNQVVATTMNDPATQQALADDFAENAVSEPLSNTTSVTAQAQDPSSGGSGKPTLVATIFGFLLVGLAVIGLGMYAWAFYKKRRKRRLQRKRERERGLGDSFNNPANTTASMVSMNSSINRSRSSPDSKLMVLPPTEYEESSESSESSAYSGVSESAASSVDMVGRQVPAAAEDASESTASDPYEGIGSDTSSKSDFTRELELAASLDRRSWIDTQRERSAMEEDVGAIQYPDQYGVQGADGAQEAPGAGAAAGIATGAAAVGVAVAGIASYPYGDEKDNDEDDDIDRSRPQSPEGDGLFGENGDEGIEWTDEGVWSPYDGYTQREIVEIDKDRGSVSSISESRMTDSRSGPGAWMKSWSSIDSFRGRGRRESKDYMKSWSSIDSARDTKTRDTLLGSMDEETESEEEELFVQASERAVEVDTFDSNKGSSIETSNAVRMSPTASATEVVVVERAVIEETKEEDDADSVLTEDIVKEVSRLARFVKKYDKKRERKLLKEREREEKKALAIKDSQSIPSESVGYDAMSDSVSALRKGRVETSPRRDRTALPNAVEETDDSSSSERSWSTTSNANKAFDDDDESSQVITESELDVMDDSDDETALSVTESDISRLGIDPFSVQKVVGMPRAANPAKRSKRQQDSSAPETSRPPVSPKQSRKGLPPLPSTPGSPDEDDSPEKIHTPVQTIKKAMRRVSSARQQKFSQKTVQEQAPPRTSKQSRGVALTEDALQELSPGNGPAGVSSSYQKQKGALAVLRKNEAILDTASSHFTEGVTSSQYEEAYRAGMIAQERQRKVFLERRSFKQMMQRVPQDPPASTAESASLHAADEKRSPPGWEPSSQESASEESRVPPAQASPKVPTKSTAASLPEERVPWSKPTAPPPPQASQQHEHSLHQPTERKAPSFKAPTFKPGVQPATKSLRPTRPGVERQSSGSKRSAPESAPQQSTRQETAPVSPATRSPPRRKSKSSAFNNVVNMFEQKPHNAIYPAGANWQFNGATR